MTDKEERIYICGFKEKPCKTCEPFYDCMTCAEWEKIREVENENK